MIPGKTNVLKLIVHIQRDGTDMLMCWTFREQKTQNPLSKKRNCDINLEGDVKIPGNTLQAQTNLQKETILTHQIEFRGVIQKRTL